MRKSLLFLFICLDFSLHGLASDTLTRAQIYNFNVGDTFDYMHSNYICGQSPTTWYERDTIQSFNQYPDSTFIIKRRMYPLPELLDTIIVTNLNAQNLLLYGQCGTSTFIDTVRLGIQQCASRLQNFIFYEVCIFPEPLYNTNFTQAWAEGLGVVETDTAYEGSCTSTFNHHLIFYSKGSERCGTPILNGAGLRHYTPIPEECAVWTDTIYPQFGYGSLIVEQIHAGNKITQGGHVYIEMIYRSYNYTTQYYTPDSLLGYYRNDTANEMLLFYRNINNSPFLSYDFNYLCPAPNCISQITIGNQLKTQWPDYIEGVGGSGGLVPVKFNKIYYGPTGTPPYYKYGKLTSFCVCGQSLYVTGQPSCELFSDIREVPVQNINFRISPNPAGTNTTVMVQGTSKSYVVKVTDIMGRALVMSDIEQDAQISTESLPNGIYFVTISNGEQSATQKLIIQR
jgi:hypothetical protein